MRLAKLSALILAGHAWAGISPLEEGRRLYENNQFQRARTVLEKALRADQSHAKVRYWLAYSCFALDDLECALAHFERLDEVMAKDPDYLFAASEVYTRQARQLSEKLSSLPGSLARKHQHLSYRHSSSGDTDNALAELREALKANPRLPGPHLDAAEILWSLKRYDEAAKELEDELRLAPRSFLANLRYGQHLLRSAKYRDAAPYLKIAVAYEKYPEAHQLLAYAHEQSGNAAEAMAEVDAGLAAFPQDRDLLEMRRSLRSRHPLVKPAVPSQIPIRLREEIPEPLALRARLRKHPEDEEALFWLNRIYSAGAAERFERLEKAAPDSAQVWLSKGLNAEFAADFTEAEVCFREALRRDGRRSGVRFSLGRVLLLQGRDEEGMRELREELKLSPYHHGAYYELGAALVRKGDAAAGGPMLERSLDLRSGFQPTKLELAKAYLQLGKAAQSIPLLREVIRTSPQHETAHYLLYRAYRGTGEAQLAQRELEIHRRLLRSANSGAKN
ncbi:MAG: tetratricopeptide repeat protein [Bryobacteraceae bacterium]